jgi:hypothetical protein
MYIVQVLSEWFQDGFICPIYYWYSLFTFHMSCIYIDMPLLLLSSSWSWWWWSSSSSLLYAKWDLSWNKCCANCVCVFLIPLRFSLHSAFYQSSVLHLSHKLHRTGVIINNTVTVINIIIFNSYKNYDDAWKILSKHKTFRTRADPHLLTTGSDFVLSPDAVSCVQGNHLISTVDNY